MKLYDVFYRGHAYDADVPLPKSSPDIRYAVCTNGESEVLVPSGDSWRRSRISDVLKAKEAAHANARLLVVKP